MPEIPSTTYATFALYRYPAKFIPQVIAYALTEYGKAGMSVLDPFAGYGTVGTTAKIYGFDYELWDLNPLLNHIHPISIMPPIDLDEKRLIKDMMAYSKPFLPDWQNIKYWHDEVFLDMLTKSWGYYHSLNNEEEKRLLLIPLIKATRYFSYNDEKRQKLSRSPYSLKRINNLKSTIWQIKFFELIANELLKIKNNLIEYQNLRPMNVNGVIKGGINSLKSDLNHNINFLITSPPYLQAQEYIRATKMDLFWLGYSEETIRKLSKLEFPYQNVPATNILSNSYYKYLENITERHMREIYTGYFFGVLGTLSKLQERITDRMFLFVGPATIRTVPIPIDDIFIEHFVNLGWKHEITLIDTIISRNMFFYKENPATGKKDNRMKTEHLIVLKK
ncbi:MAG TPA: hypothetical protein PLE10_05795 [Brevefilum sp.]|nr:hypothetical protein [Brevefilum sp.]HOR19324.1 hypothetical protein [Brevefilum sp.]HPL69929.1 hypothetical protein [Brevefilum sp.]